MSAVAERRMAKIRDLVEKHGSLEDRNRYALIEQACREWLAGRVRLPQPDDDDGYAPAPEKAAPIPAEVRKLAERQADIIGVTPHSDMRPFVVHASALAIMQDRADRASQEERIREDERAEAWEQREAALMDCQYVAGAQAGWNCAQADNPNEAFAALIKSRDGRIAALKQARARLRGSAS